MSNHPDITVLMPVYNAEQYLEESIESVINQTYNNFELLIINDGSTDSSEQIVKNIDDPRITLVNNDGNRGLIYTLNKGIELAKGSYIARMDSDDICHPARLDRQIRFLQGNEDVAMAGTFVEIIDDNGKLIDHGDYPVQSTEIRHTLLEYCCFCHPSVMYRKDAVLAAGGYRSEFRHAEDYDLWLRIAECYPVANVPEYLLKYRMHSSQVSYANHSEQYRIARECIRAALRRRGLADADITRRMHLSFKQKIFGRKGSIAKNYLYFANQYRASGNWADVRQASLYAIINSPLMAKAYRLFFTSCTYSLLGKERISAIRWYWKKFTNAVRFGQR